MASFVGTVLAVIVDSQLAAGVVGLVIVVVVVVVLES